MVGREVATVVLVGLSQIMNRLHKDSIRQYLNIIHNLHFAVVACSILMLLNQYTAACVANTVGPGLDKRDSYA